ncbi:MAG: hypothetical protein LBC11_02210 [Puniceicoccales bacterium]|nr:hypothetical protein [Puniceicoccales bacterium]
MLSFFLTKNDGVINQMEGKRDHNRRAAAGKFSNRWKIITGSSGQESSRL